VSRIERGHLRPLSVDAILRVAEALEIRIDWSPRWRGGDLDRMLNAGHAAMHNSVARLFRRLPWLMAPEVTFSIYGERGTIDILAFHPPTGALVVIELKTELVDVQDLIGSVDRYRRLAAKSPGTAVGSPGRSAAGLCFATPRRTVVACPPMPMSCALRTQTTAAPCVGGFGHRSAASRGCPSSPTARAAHPEARLRRACAGFGARRPEHRL
jgi:hypothetical protein